MANGSIQGSVVSTTGGTTEASVSVGSGIVPSSPPSILRGQALPARLMNDSIIDYHDPAMGIHDANNV
jgi:hypothetical protein